MGKPRIPVELEREAVRLYRDEKMGIIAISKKLGVGETTLFRVMDRNGIPRRDDTHGNQRKVSASEFDAIVAYYESGESLKQIAVRYNVKPVTISYILKRCGITPRSRGNTYTQINASDKREIARLYQEEGLSQTAIAERYNISQGNVHHILAKQGISAEHRIPKRERHGSWKGGRVILPSGYVGIKLEVGHPFYAMTNSGGYIPEHRLIMAQALGRLLSRDETVHHINGNKLDNHLGNLQLRHGKHGRGQVYKCADCGSFHIIAVEIEEPQNAS